MKILKLLMKIFGVLLALLIVFFIFAYFATDSEYNVPKTVKDDTGLPRVELDGILFHAEAFGNADNPCVIVIHGGPGGDYKSLLSLKALSDEYYVVFYDQRGSGLSERVPESQFTYDNFIKDLDNIINYYGKGRKVNLIGHSWGAMLASGYMCKYPFKIDKAVLAEPGFLNNELYQDFVKSTGGMNAELGLQSLWLFGKLWFRSLHISEPDDDAALDYFFGQIVTADIETNPMRGYFCNDDPKTGVNDFWRFGSKCMTTLQSTVMDEDGNITISFVDGIDKFENKILLMASECNRLIGIEHQKKQAEYFKKVEFVVIPGAGHTMLGEKPELCNKIIREYFEE